MVLYACKACGGALRVVQTPLDTRYTCSTHGLVVRLLKANKRKRR